MSKVLALTPFDISKPSFGGAERCYNLLTRVGPIDVIGLNWDGVNSYQRIGDMSYELIGADQSAVEQSRKLRANGVITYDPMPSLCKNNLTTIRKEIDLINPDLVVLEHPWLVDLIGDRPFIYDAHNFETYNTGTQFGVNSYDYQLVKEIEYHAASQAEHITYCSQQDIELMRQMFNIDTPATHIPNGVTLPDQVSDNKTRNLIFIGSVYQPNINAAQRLIDLAPQLPGYRIQILGQCANYVTNTHNNVLLVGHVNEEILDYYFRNAHAFINLTTHGSGTHLKIGRALAYGIPTLTTPKGGRGYTNVIHTNPFTLPHQLNTLDWDYWHTKALEEAATINWDTIAQTFKKVIQEHS